MSRLHKKAQPKPDRLHVKNSILIGQHEGLQEVWQKMVHP